MRAKVKFGCLRNAESMNAGLHPMSNVRQWMEEYQCERMAFDLPDQGVARSELDCPICAQKVTLKLSSPGVVFTILGWALVAAGFVCFGLAALLYFGPGTGSTVVKQIALGVAVLGIGGLIAAAFAEQFPAAWVKDSLISISNDEVRNHEQAPGYSGMRGHKLIEVDFS